MTAVKYDSLLNTEHLECAVLGIEISKPPPPSTTEINHLPYLDPLTPTLRSFLECGTWTPQPAPTTPRKFKF